VPRPGLGPVTFTPDGSALLVANEAEPSSYNRPDSIDNEGSVSVIAFRRGIGNVKDLTQADVRTADFRAFNGGVPADPLWIDAYLGFRAKW
jgi:hypothetical protein